MIARRINRKRQRRAQRCPGCCGKRRQKQLLCDDCWWRLPADVRRGALHSKTAGDDLVALARGLRLEAAEWRRRKPR